jgi:NtrC-family two-component system sensor histidine kinase KinB
VKLSIRSKFSVGIVFLLIILALSVFSAYYMNKLSKETGAILKENYISVVYAREMAGGLTNINQEITNSFLAKTNSDTSFIKKELSIIDKSLQLEKNNITEPGEDKLVSGLESGLNEY